MSILGGGNSSHTLYGDAAGAEASYANERNMRIWFYHLASYSASTRKTMATQFKGFLTNFTDSYRLNWKMYHCYGRNDPIQTYGSTTRTVSFSWDIVANSEAEAASNLKKCTNLFKMLYPVYGERGNALSIKAPPLMGIRFSNLIQQQDGAALTGACSGFNFSPDLNAGFFDSYVDGSDILLPKVINMRCTLTVTHRHPIGWDKDTGRQITEKEEIAEFYCNGQNSMDSFPYAVGFTPRAVSVLGESQAYAIPSTSGAPSGAPDPGAGPANDNDNMPSNDDLEELPEADDPPVRTGDDDDDGPRLLS